VAKVAVPSTENRPLPLPFILQQNALVCANCVGEDAFVRPPSEARITQPMSSVSGGRQRILLLVRTALSLRRSCCEVRPLRAKAQSVTECSLTKAVHKTRGHSAPTEIQSVVKFTATSRRAYQHRPGFEPPTVIPVPWLRPQLQRGCFARAARRGDSTRISVQVHRHAGASPWKSGPLRAASVGPMNRGFSP